MKTLLLASAAALLAASAASAQTADTGFSLGAGYTYLDTDGLDFDALTVRGGYDFNAYFGVEGEALIGLGDEDFGGLDASLNYGVGAFAKARYPLSETVTAFARAGYVVAELELEGFGSDDADGFAFGAGGEYAFGANAIRGEYTRYEFEDDAEADGFSVSYVRRF
ncbi:MAG: porin family protein [Oceanicaulis sp.]